MENDHILLYINNYHQEYYFVDIYLPRYIYFLLSFINLLFLYLLSTFYVLFLRIDHIYSIIN